MIQADASDVAMGAMLLQANVKGGFEPCTYTSRKLTEIKRRWAIWEKEAFAVRWALLIWRHFLEVAKQPFKMWTDHKNLEALKTPRKLSPKQVRWLEYFNQFNFALCCIPGGKNFMADVLSILHQYNSVRPEVIQPVIPSKQLTIPVVICAQKKLQPELPNAMCEELKVTLKSDQWFLFHTKECTMKDGIAWIGTKLYVSTSSPVGPGFESCWPCWFCEDFAPSSSFGGLC